ncbi:MAG: (2Fe-2S) ferredoxin domain-containing protein [Kiritimatiellae bacterium]|nr:(2Fe-2S) ferredoxin domain-containing protein [Kiritimatiellia bacterium]
MSKKLTLDALRKLRAKMQQEQSLRTTGNKGILVTVGMGTCGVAAGAQATLKAINESLAANGAANVTVRQTGCMGLCHSEPTVEVQVPGMPTVIYGNVTADFGREIVEKHLLGGRLLDNHICDRPAMDIVR